MINHKKYEIIVALIVPEIVQELRTTDGNSIMELRHCDVVVYNQKATWQAAIQCRPPLFFVVFIVYPLFRHIV